MKKKSDKESTLINKARRTMKSSGLKGLGVFAKFHKGAVLTSPKLAKEIESLKADWDRTRHKGRFPGTKGRSAGHGLPKISKVVVKKKK